MSATSPSRFAPCPRCGLVRQVQGHHRDALCRRCWAPTNRKEAPDVLRGGAWVPIAGIQRWVETA